MTATATAGRQPNLLVIMTDQQKATAIRLYGNPDVATPALESLAGGGSLYRHAFTPHPLCVPARVSFWTGRWPHQHGSRSNEILMPEGEPHAARLLHQAGYQLALVGKNHCFRPADLRLFQHTYLAGHSGPIGDDTAAPGVSEAREFYRSRDFRVRWAAHPIPYPRERCAAWLIAGHVIQLLEAQAAGRIDQPLCIWMSIPDPHPPYAAPQPYAGAFDPAALTLPPRRTDELAGKPVRQRFFHRLSRFPEATEDDIRRALAMYYAQIAFADDCVGRVLQAIDRLGQRQGTVVAFTSDHGDYAGEHAMMTKSSTMYDCMTRVPLLLSWPGTLPQGVVHDDLVSTMDVMPTLLRLAGVSPAPAAPSLAPSLHGVRLLPGTAAATGAADLPPREAIWSEYGAGGPSVSTRGDVAAGVEAGPALPRLPYLRAREGEGRLKMVRTRRWKYVYDPGDPLPELYDLEQDPWELTNLATRPEHAATIQQLRGHLLDWSLCTEDTRPVPLYYDLDTFQPTDQPQHFALTEGRAG